MLSNNQYDRDPVLHDLSEISVNTLKDLELAKKALQENDMHMK